MSFHRLWHHLGGVDAGKWPHGASGEDTELAQSRDAQRRTWVTVGRRKSSLWPVCILENINSVLLPCSSRAGSLHGKFGLLTHCLESVPLPELGAKLTCRITSREAGLNAPVYTLQTQMLRGNPQVPPRRISP